MKPKDYRVRAVACQHEASEQETYEALVRATDPLTEAWERLGKASRIGIKINHDKPVDRWVFHKGMLQQLVCDKVVRATLRLLRERLPNVPLIVDAGLGVPSHATQVMEWGYDAVLLNTAVAQAGD